MNNQILGTEEKTKVREKFSLPDISNRAKSMQASPLRKLSATAEARKKTGVKVYHLNIGQPDLPTDTTVFYVIKNLEIETLSYAPSNGLAVTLSAWKKYFKNFGIDFDESEMIITNGGSEAIIFALSTVCDSGEEVLVFEPFYTNYNGFATLADVKLIPIALSIKNGFHLPKAEEIEKFITEKTKAILINNPSNPTGTIYSREELSEIVELVKKHNLFLLSDEVYREFAFDAQFTSVMDFPEIAEQNILLDSCSKRFNVCGARMGVLASHNKDVVSTAFKFAMARLCVPTIEQLAVVPLLENPTKYTKPIIEEFRKRRDIVYEKLKEIPGVTYYKPEGAFYIVIGLPIKDSEHFAQWLIENFDYENETLLVAPAQGFYATEGKGTNEIRLAFVLNENSLIRSLQILRIALEEYKKIFS